MKKRIDQQWICVVTRRDKIDMVEYGSLKCTRKESIASMTATKSGRPPAYTWDQLKKFGWRCVKANISIEINTI